MKNRLRCLERAIGVLVRPVLDGSDTAEDRKRKWLLVPMLDLAFVSVLVTPFHIDLWNDGPLLLQTLLAAIFYGSLMCYVYRTKRCPRWLADVVCTTTALFVLYRDFVQYGSLDMSTWVIMIIDLMLLCTCTDVTLSWVRNTAVVYIMFQGLEQAGYLGLYSVLPELSDMEPPPKRPSSVVLYMSFAKIMVLVADFVMTKYFCQQTNEERARMQNCIAIAERVSEAFVKFDLEAAEAALEGLSNEELSQTFRRLLQNLDTYRPYLPEALFVSEEGEDDYGSLASSPRAGVAAPRGRAAIVFTDIVSSTQIWEADSTGMRKALAVHNMVVRRCIAECEGYEVKTIGDAFMVAFRRVEEACRFGLGVQQGLYEAEWPEALQGVAACALHEGMWNGLRVRIGVEVGEVDTQPNPVTGRMDYFGTTVNTAARLEGTALPGTVAVSSQVLEELGEEGMAGLGDVATKIMKDVRLKGISDPVTATLLVPEKLCGRLTPMLPCVPSWDRETGQSNHQTLSRSSCSTIVLERSCFAQVTAWSVCTVGHVSVDYAFLDHETDAGGALGQLLGHVMDCVERTGGVLTAVGSSSIVATWNLGLRCTQHKWQGLVGTTLMWKGLEVARGSVFVGVATGSAMQVRAGSERRRFVLSIGEVVEVAGALALAGSKEKRFLLVGSLPGADVENHPYDVSWHKVGEWSVSNGTMVVYHVHVDTGDGWSDETVNIMPPYFLRSTVGF